MAEIPKLLLISDCPCFRTIQTAVLIETLTVLGAEVTWSSCVSFLAVSWMFVPDVFFRTSSPPRIMLLPRECKLNRQSI